MKQCKLIVSGLAAVVVIAAVGPVLGREARSPHDPGRRVGQVTSIVFSPDGRWVAASYFRHADNRPGTDWGAFAAEWDLVTGKRTIVRDAFGPIAFRPDGKVLAMGIYKRSRRPGYRMRPLVRLALWDVGRPSVRSFLSPEVGTADTSITAAAWSRDGKRLAAVTQGGDILLGDGDGKVVSADVDIPSDSPLAKERVRRSMRPTGVAFTADGRSLVTTLDIRRRWHRAILWKKGPETGRFKPAETYSDGLITRDASIASLLDTLSKDKSVFVVAKRGNLTATTTDPPSTKLISPTDRVRISSDGHMLAISGRGKVALRTYAGKLMRTFPGGGGAVAFSPDCKLLAAAGSRGIIRIWEIASGRLVRSLRLDGKDDKTVLVAAVQCASKFGDPAGNRKKLAKLVKRAAFRGAKIVVLPETAITGYLTYDKETTWQVGRRELSEGLKGVDPKNAAETVPGPSTKLFGELADRFGIYVTVPLVEVDRKTGKYYNTSVLVGPDGRILIHYRKRNPWMWAERGWVTKGDLGNPVVDTPFGRLGLLICFDVHEQFDIMSRLRIDTLLYSIAWVDDPDSDWFSKQLPERTTKCGFNVVGANWTVPADPKPDWHGYGKSLIISASGRILAKVSGDLAEEVIYAEVPTAPRRGPVRPSATTDEQVNRRSGDRR